MEGSTQLLGQQQILEPPPVRRLAVHVGHAAWWGIDPSTLRVSAAYCANGASAVARGARTASFEAGEGPARLSAIYRETALFAVELARVWPAPGVVLVEQPSGKVENKQLVYAVGVIQAAFYDGLYQAYGHAVRMETVASAHWKRVACGSGAIYKPKKGDKAPYGVLTWARANGYAGWSWDEADALGIAECARREIGLEQRGPSAVLGE